MASLRIVGVVSLRMVGIWTSLVPEESIGVVVDFFFVAHVGTTTNGLQKEPLSVCVPPSICVVVRVFNFWFEAGRRKSCDQWTLR